jgi:hypothetical protein
MTVRQAVVAMGGQSIMLQVKSSKSVDTIRRYTNTNTASGHEALVSGGQGSTASGEQSSVSGGQSNTASGLLAVVSGGFGNTTSGDRSSVSGGQNVTQATEVSWASGSEAEEVVVGNFRSP